MCLLEWFRYETMIAGLRTWTLEIRKLSSALWILYVSDEEKQYKKFGELVVRYLFRETMK